MPVCAWAASASAAVPVGRPGLGLEWIVPGDVMTACAWPDLQARGTTAPGLTDRTILTVSKITSAPNCPFGGHSCVRF